MAYPVSEVVLDARPVANCRQTAPLARNPWSWKVKYVTWCQESSVSWSDDWTRLAFLFRRVYTLLMEALLCKRFQCTDLRCTTTACCRWEWDNLDLFGLGTKDTKLQQGSPKASGLSVDLLQIYIIIWFKLVQIWFNFGSSLGEMSWGNPKMMTAAWPDRYIRWWPQEEHIAVWHWREHMPGGELGKGSWNCWERSNGHSIH